MEGNLHGFILTEIMKQHVPVTVTINKEKADYAMVGLALGDRSYFKDSIEGNVQIYRITDEVLIWTAAAGDRTLILSVLHRGGLRKLAERIGKQMREDELFGVVAATPPATAPQQAGKQ